MGLISRDEVMRLAESGKLLSGSFGERAKDIINSLPTIEERREGKWINDINYSGWTCTNCGYHDGCAVYNFCPNCGAKMKGE